MHKYKKELKRNEKNRSEQRRLCNFSCHRFLLTQLFLLLPSCSVLNSPSSLHFTFTTCTHILDSSFVLFFYFFLFSHCTPPPGGAPSAPSASSASSAAALGFVCCFCVSAAYFNSCTTSNFPFRCIDKYFFVRVSPFPFPIQHFSFPHFYFIDSYDLWLSLSASHRRFFHVCAPWHSLAASPSIYPQHANFPSPCALLLPFLISFLAFNSQFSVELTKLNIPSLERE